MSEWLDRIDREPFIGVLAAIVVALAAAIFVSFVWLVLRSLWDGRITRLRERFWNGLGRDLVVAVGDPERETAWVARAKHHPADVLRACLNDYMIRTAGDYKEGLARLYRALGLLDGDLLALGSLRWSVRMRALRRLASVVTPEHRQVIVQMAAEGGEVRLLVAQIIGRIGTAQDVLGLLASWRIAGRISEYPVHVMIDAMSTEALREVLRQWDAFPQPELQRIVLSIGARRVPSACQGILPRAAGHRSVEVRIACARACGTITSDESLDLLASLGRDPAWEVRAQAMKALATHRSPAAADRLVSGLSDASFWVRQNAAAALGHHGKDGIRRLREIADNVGDRYARDAAEHVLTDLAIANHEALAEPRAALAGGSV